MMARLFPIFRLFSCLIIKASCLVTGGTVSPQETIPALFADKENDSDGKSEEEYALTAEDQEQVGSGAHFGADIFGCRKRGTEPQRCEVAYALKGGESATVWRSTYESKQENASVRMGFVDRRADWQETKESALRV
jgi:hypothetical protein